MGNKSSNNNKTIDAVIDNKLYISDIRHATDTKSIKNKKITHIVNILEIDIALFGLSYSCNIPKKNILNINIVDDPEEDISKYFISTNEWIFNAIKNGGNVLVHCHSGISRSATIVIAYLMEHNKMTYAQANKYLYKRRNIIHPNHGFVARLKTFENTLKIL